MTQSAQSARAAWNDFMSARQQHTDASSQHTDASSQHTDPSPQHADARRQAIRSAWANIRPQPADPPQASIRPQAIRAAWDGTAITFSDTRGGLRAVLSQDPIPSYWLRQLQHSASVCHAAPGLADWLRAAGVTCSIVTDTEPAPAVTAKNGSDVIAAV